MPRPSSATSCRAASPPATPPPDNDGRDAAGRFAKNNPGGPGNPFARRIAEFRKAIAAAATPEKIAAVVAKLEEKALEGDVAAAKLYLAYAIGKPGPAPDPDRLDVDEGRLAQQEMELFRLMAQAVFYPLLETALDMVRTGRPAASDTFVQKTLDGIAALDAAQPPEAAAGNGADGAGAPPIDGAPQAAAPPSANGANGGPPARGPQSRPSEGQPGPAPPTGNGANGATARPTRRRPAGEAPPGADGWGNGPPPGG
jgi:hypothetical protein